MENQLPFNNKVALVTGSSRGIGKGIALHLAHLGANLVINYFRNRDPAEETANAIRSIGRQAFVVRANVGEIDQIEKLFNNINQEFGHLDIFINNAASGYNRPALQQRPKGWDWTMDINARAFLFAVQKAVPLMEKVGGGHVVAITSPGGERVLSDYIVVGASKAALNSLVRYLAVELAEKNIIVNAVSPGVVETEIMQHFSAFKKQGILEKIKAITPASRLVTPKDIAKVVAFLCTPDAEMIRGQIIQVDGGICLPLNTSGAE